MTSVTCPQLGNHAIVGTMTGKSFRLASALVVVTATASYAAPRISGTYVAHGSGFAEMLQLTQTDNGQLTGVWNSVSVGNDGKISSEQTSVTGAVDGGQITLSARSAFSFLSGGTVSGTVQGNTIVLNTTDRKGNVLSEQFVRSSAKEFKGYTDKLHLSTQSIQVNNRLLKSASQCQQNVKAAEQWIQNAELHAGRIENVKRKYDEIENRMSALVNKERATRDALQKGQISLDVGQGNLAGGQVDLDVNQVWDYPIEATGTELYKRFSDWNGDCGTSEELRNRGASSESIAQWDRACKAALAEKAKFIPIYKRIMQQRQELKSFQSAAQSRRQVLVEEASRGE
jgi:gas vesicle protein